MRGHHDLATHLIGRFVEDRLPEGQKQLVRVIDAGIDYGPYFAAQDLCRDVGISPGVQRLSQHARHNLSQHSLDAALVSALNLPRHVAQQALQDVNAREVVDESCVLRFALLEEVILVKYRLQGDVFFV